MLQTKRVFNSQSLQLPHFPPESIKFSLKPPIKFIFYFSDVFTFDPDDAGAFNVFSDQKTAGGGWTVFQKRLDGPVYFLLSLEDYKRGFGNFNGEFWLN